MIGNTYGKLTVQSLSKNARGVSIAHCICQCGKKVTPTIYKLRDGAATSCGCNRKKAHTRICFT